MLKIETLLPVLWSIRDVQKLGRISMRFDTEEEVERHRDLVLVMAYALGINLKLRVYGKDKLLVISMAKELQGA